MSKFKLYHFSSGSLEFVEARWCKTKLALLSVTLGIVILVLGFKANHALGDVLGVGFQKENSLRAENAHLRDRIHAYTNNLRNLQATIGMLGDRGNELRLNVDLPKIDADTRKAGYGGTDDRLEFGVSTDINKLMNDLSASLTKAEKELQLEQTIYHETAAKYDQNKARYPCIPAIKPMQGFFSMTGFGMRFHPVYHQMLLHEGLDIANASGTPVHATGDGIVAMAGSTSTGIGTMVVINHGYGYTTVYGHLSKILVRAGSRVKRGATIALSGSTGVVTGPHLHYEVRLRGQLQNPVDHFFDGLDKRKNEERQTSSM